MKTLTCRETIELLMDYLEGQLSPEDRAGMDAHFADCKPCLEFVHSYERTPSLLRTATAVKIPPEVSERLVLFLKQKRGGGS